MYKILFGVCVFLITYTLFKKKISGEIVFFLYSVCVWCPVYLTDNDIYEKNCPHWISQFPNIYSTV